MKNYQYVCVMNGLNKSYPNKEVLKNVWLSFLPGAKIGVIGHNGSGKSTILKIMAGIDKEFTGEAWIAEGIKAGYLPQEPQLDSSKNVFENIMLGVGEVTKLIDQFNEISNKFSEPMSDDEMNNLIMEQGELQEKIDAVNGWEIEREVEIAMHALNCPPKNASVDKISGGERRRVALCKLLLEKPDMLLLDEPTNHLDAQSVSWLENYLQKYPGTVVLVTHDRYFLDNVTKWILEIDRGECIPWNGNYSSWLEQKEERLGQENKEEDDRQKQIKRELEWIRQSPRARQAKSKARVNEYNKLVNQEKKGNVGVAQIHIPDGPRLGDIVINTEGLTKQFAGRTLIDNLNITIPPGAVVGIIGPNGYGKTTLFKMISGQDKDYEGKIRLGDTVTLGYVDQSRDSLDGDKNVWEEISGGLDEIKLGKYVVKSRAYCASFNFRGADQQKLVGQLSGGERNRVHLAKMLRHEANVLLLDEPTNDLDVDTLRALEEAIQEFSGCVLVISHDRWFLDRIATHILAFEGDQVFLFEGNFADYEVDLEQRKPELFGNKSKFKKIARQ
jgi:ATP-binding cassette ChvD family protein